MSKPAVSFLGLGAMGFGMATHLVQRGYAVTGFDVYGPTLERFCAAGGSTAVTAAEAAQGRDFCVCMVATAQQAQAVLLGNGGADSSPAVPALPRGATLLLCSTVPSGYVRQLRAQLASDEVGRPDVHLIDCPVSGGAYRAAEGTLTVMAGGDEDAVAAGRFLLEELADRDKLYVVGGSVGAGSNMKMCHQVLAANQILAASEAIGFAARLGLDPARAGDAAVASDAASWMLAHRLPRIVHPRFEPLASAVAIIAKDTAIITSEARNGTFPTPMTSAAEQAYLSGLARGYAPDDDGGLVRLYLDEGRDLAATAASAAASASGSEVERLGRVQALLRGIHLCSAAESLALSHHAGLDLDQVLNLCVSAAGGSGVLESVGQEMVHILRGEAGAGTGGGAPAYDLQKIAGELQAAVDEAQKLRAPLFLGSQALNLIRLAQRQRGGEQSAATVVKLWAVST